MSLCCSSACLPRVVVVVIVVVVVVVVVVAAAIVTTASVGVVTANAKVNAYCVGSDVDVLLDAFDAGVYVADDDANADRCKHVECCSPS
jgi:hypothetical protein